ncbi:hypothetical protein PoB_003727900 [Plakobranchus ocellatus]|uniref:Uncharacterized protein n=1 Tax=Plakobranchus ocellatus TaxID=259542 RepID=A0AAV4ASI9_9GAST|nr:hypothetical protein PoB_003727900 [Plakobranchus ocellatus]
MFCNDGRVVCYDLSEHSQALPGDATTCETQGQPTMETKCATVSGRTGILNTSNIGAPNRPRGIDTRGGFRLCSFSEIQSIVTCIGTESVNQYRRKSALLMRPRL